VRSAPPLLAENGTNIPEGQPAPGCLVAGCGGSLVGGR
jgi:hypothetical protein